MVNSENLIPKTEMIYELKEEIQLPMLSEITDKGGKVTLPSQLVNKLRDPNARFRIDLGICPMWTEEWEDLQVSCMSSGCGNTTVGKWKHGNCSYSYPSNIQWSTHANLKCPSCGKVADISQWRFICHGSGCTETTTGITRLSDAMIMILEDKNVSQEFVALFLRNAREMFKNK